MAQGWVLMTDDWRPTNDGWWIMDDGYWVMDDGWRMADMKWMIKKIMATLWLDIEDEQDWKLNNLKCHPPEIVGNGGWGSLWTSSPKWIGLGLDGVREGWRKGAMTEIGGGEGWGVGISSLHFLLVWPDGTIVDGHADNWDWKLVARINYRLFLPHIQLWGLLWKKKSEKISFPLWAIARDKSSSTSHTRWNHKKTTCGDAERVQRGVWPCTRVRADPQKDVG